MPNSRFLSLPNAESTVNITISKEYPAFKRSVSRGRV